MNKLLSTQLLRFLIVGSSAFLVHWLCVIFIVSYSGIAPLLANIFGFLSAFIVSYLGHKNWTFSTRHRPHLTSIRRFMVVAIIGFIGNEISYAFLLNVAKIDYRTGLFIALIVSAVATYLLSHYWAFNATR